MRSGGCVQESRGWGSQLKPIGSLSCLRRCGPGSGPGSRWPIAPTGSWCRFWTAASMCVQGRVRVCVCFFVWVKRRGAGGTSVSDLSESLAVRTWRFWRASGRGERERRGGEGQRVSPDASVTYIFKISPRPEAVLQYIAAYGVANRNGHVPAEQRMQMFAAHVQNKSS